jgi:hypothetical protein
VNKAAEKISLGGFYYANSLVDSPRMRSLTFFYKRRKRAHIVINRDGKETRYRKLRGDVKVIVRHDGYGPTFRQFLRVEDLSQMARTMGRRLF